MVGRLKSRKQKQSMKRIGNLYDKIISLENLRLADEKARKGKTKSYGVKVHDKNREENILRLHDILANGTFRTSEYFVFKIFEPKERDIYRLPYYPDRIVHHAVMNILEPIWVSVMISETCACIKGRGINKAREYMQKYLRDKDGTRYCLKIDVRKFYPSIDHDCLKQIVRLKIKDERLLRLLDEIIDSAEGVPIGNYLSQYFANLYLAYLDHEIKEVLKIKYYVRYADDMVLLSDNKTELSNALSYIKMALSRIKLSLKGNEQIFPVADNKQDKHGRGVDFVGYVFYHEHTMLRKSIKKNLCRRCSKINKSQLAGKEYRIRVSPWLGWTKHSDSKNLLYKLTKNRWKN